MVARTLAAALVLAVAAPATAGLADRAGATFALMADDFIAAFQPREGVVVHVNGDSIYLDLGADAVQVGQEFTIFRKGDVFTHPFTGKPLGRYEDVLGYGQVKLVRPRFSEARFIPAPGKPRPVPEDGARITKGRIRTAVTPVLDLTGSAADLRRVPYLIAGALERSKRFQVVDPIIVRDTLTSASVRVAEVLARPDRASRAATDLDVVGWVVPILIERRGITYLDVTWVSAVTGTALFSRRRPLVPAGTIEEQRFPWEPRAED
ncbi:MAG: hypothetical protein HYU51_07655 [Candidatus Rokubacteria bacterium]|nr:hypothetical protein [Candidatus Rokubacteria bacterium]